MAGVFRKLSYLRTKTGMAIGLAVVFVGTAPFHADEASWEPWLLGQAFHVPSEYSNQESGYFSIVEGKNGRVYIGTAKYGVNAYLVEFDPMGAVMRMVVDVHRTIGTFLRGFGAQAKIHTRNNVGASGKIYFGSKQGYPEKGEDRSAYPGGYVMAYDPKTDKTENFGMPMAKHGIISVTPDESRGLIYVSTCDDGRPIESSHFMVYDMKAKTYVDLGETNHSYAFIVLDDKGRAYHPVHGGTIRRYDPETRKAEDLKVTVDGEPAPMPITKSGAILNWDASPDGKTLFCVEMSTNQLYAFDLTAAGTIPGKAHGELLVSKRTDCRAMCVGPSGKVWAAVSDRAHKRGSMLHLVSFTPGQKSPRDHGQVAIANPDYIQLTDDKGKPRPWHHTLRKEPDGTLTPWQPMGVCESRDGGVYVLTIAPYTLIRYRADQVK
jgi:sugar lactone lactonase YvrE